MEYTVTHPTEAAVDGTAAEAAPEERKSQVKKLSRASSSDSDEMYTGGSRIKGGKAIPASEDVIEHAIRNGAEILSCQVMNKTLILNGTNRPPPPTSLEAHQKKELDLRLLYSLPDSQKFYCPSCDACITKVIIDLQDGHRLKSRPPSPPPAHEPVTRVIQPPTTGPTEPPRQQPAIPGQIVVPYPEMTGQEVGGKILCSNCFSFLTPIGAWISSRIGGKKPVPPSGAGTVTEPEVSTGTGSSGILPELEIAGEIIVSLPPDEVPTIPRQSGGRKLEIIKSIVYGGLTESITSLGIVTSAASANTPTENIVALALANLITGLIVILNNLSGLKSSEIKTETNEETEAVQKDQYEEALGDRQHYILHFLLVILSFIVSGLLPPLVYGFSFRDTNDKDMKLVAVAAASLIFIALLAIGKAYIQKSKKWLDYVKTVSYYVTIGVGASGLSYVAGREIDKLIQQLGWFKPNSSTPTLSLPDLDFTKPAWVSF